MTLLTFLLIVLASARIFRLLSIDEIAEPVRNGVWRFVALWPKGDVDFIARGWHCPFCLGYWLAVGWTLTGVAWGDTFVWQLVAGAFAANYVAAVLNTHLDITQLKSETSHDHSFHASGPLVGGGVSISTVDDEGYDWASDTWVTDDEAE